jgi:hypothetical protein
MDDGKGAGVSHRRLNQPSLLKTGPMGPFFFALNASFGEPKQDVESITTINVL